MDRLSLRKAKSLLHQLSPIYFFAFYKKSIGRCQVFNLQLQDNIFDSSTFHTTQKRFLFTHRYIAVTNTAAKYVAFSIRCCLNFIGAQLINTHQTKEQLPQQKENTIFITSNIEIFHCLSATLHRYSLITIDTFLSCV